MHDAWSLRRIRAGRRIAVAFLGILAAALCAVGCFGLATPTLASDPNAPKPDGSIGGPDVQADPPVGTVPAPQPSPVTSGGPSDASSSDASPDASATGAPSTDAALPDSSDASADQSTATPLGVRCGGGAVPATLCAGATPTCCATGASGGGFNYACTPAGGCGGVSIECANGGDCPSGDICCFGATLQACTPLGTCPAGHQVCDPNSSTSCPAGTTCLQLAFNGVLVPYFSCQ